MFTPTWGDDPIWLYNIFKLVETTSFEVFTAYGFAVPTTMHEDVGGDDVHNSLLCMDDVYKTNYLGQIIFDGYTLKIYVSTAFLILHINYTRVATTQGPILKAWWDFVASCHALPGCCKVTSTGHGEMEKNGVGPAAAAAAAADDDDDDDDDGDDDDDDDDDDDLTKQVDQIEAFEYHWFSVVWKQSYQNDIILMFDIYIYICSIGLVTTTGCRWL